EASEAELGRRIEQRQNDASEATVKVLYQQLKSAEPLSRQERIDAIIIDTETDKALEVLINSLSKFTTK
ncbi:MAG: aminoglycoside phosphotransferase, partial [Methylobacter sp.]|nr:aminoglycoside phosphotransferase [Methylobacter sp.]